MLTSTPMETFSGFNRIKLNGAYRFARGKEMIVIGSLEYFAQRFKLK